MTEQTNSQGPKSTDSIAQLQGHSLDYGAKCRNACYGGIAAAWALHSTDNLNSFFFALAIGCFLVSLAIDIFVSSDGMEVLITKIIEAQQNGENNIKYTSEEALKFSKQSSPMKWLVVIGFSLIALGYVISALHAYVHICR